MLIKGKNILKKTFLIIFLSFFIIACSSGGGDDLPGLSTAPESHLRAMACSMQGIMEIAYQIAINGSYPNVTISGHTVSFSNAVVNVQFDYDDYDVAITGTLNANDDGSRQVYDISLSRCESYFETLYCTYHIEAKKSGNDYKYTKVILNGKEYEYDL